MQLPVSHEAYDTLDCKRKCRATSCPACSSIAVVCRAYWLSVKCCAFLRLQVSADQYNHLQYEREAEKRTWQGKMQSRDADLQRLQSELQRLTSDLGQR